MEVEFIGKPNLERFVVLFLKLDPDQPCRSQGMERGLGPVVGR